MHLEASRYKLPDVLRVLTEMNQWPFADDIPRPTWSALTRARELVLAVGPLTPDGPQKVILAPSIRGGVVVTFVLADGRDVTVASMNNQVAVVVLGKGWTGQLRVTETEHADAIARARELSRPV